MNKTRGFTLVELMTVVAIVGILAAIAIPAYTSQIRKSRRAQAMQSLSDAQVRQENWRSSHATYGTAVNVPFATSEFYTFSKSTPGAGITGCATATSANSFLLTATATGAQAGDTACATMTLASYCGIVVKTPSGRTCWQ